MMRFLASSSLISGCTGESESRLFTTQSLLNFDGRLTAGHATQRSISSSGSAAPIRVDSGTRSGSTVPPHAAPPNIPFKFNFGKFGTGPLAA
eukprot:1005268-Rhodomonas_salina.1